MQTEIQQLYKKANIGTRKQAASQAVAGGFILLDTQLITARWEQARQWIVTLMPTLKHDGNVPWTATFDGTTGPFPPVLPNFFTAPVLPDAPFFAKCELRWGAGGTAFTTRFDYPVHGCIFGVTADTFDLNVVWPPEVVAEVPDVGAFMVPGVAADQTPLHWLEPLLAGIAASPGPGNIGVWSVKPWAREARIAVSAPGGGAIGAVQVTWQNTAGAVVFSERKAITASGEAFSVEVPGAATILRLANLGAVPIDAFVEWQIGLT